MDITEVEVYKKEDSDSPTFTVRQRLLLETIIAHPTYDIEKVFRTLKVQADEREKYLSEYYQPIFQDKLVKIIGDSEAVIKRAAPEAAKTLVKLLGNRKARMRFESSREILNREHIIKHGDTPILNMINMPTVILKVNKQVKNGQE